ncbi:hypothetical protein [Caviibacter abscessus]|nr:hypothetical protein [Caviibacter abscessus]
MKKILFTILILSVNLLFASSKNKEVRNRENIGKNVTGGGL